MFCFCTSIVLQLYIILSRSNVKGESLTSSCANCARGSYYVRRTLTIHVPYMNSSACHAELLAELYYAELLVIH